MNKKHLKSISQHALLKITHSMVILLYAKRKPTLTVSVVGFSVTLQKILWNAALDVTLGITASYAFVKSAPNLSSSNVGWLSLKSQ